MISAVAVNIVFPVAMYVPWDVNITVFVSVLLIGAAASELTEVAVGSD